MAEKIVIDFSINIKEALQNITDAKTALAGLREEQKALQKEILKGTATDDMKKRFGELTVEIRELTNVINTNNREIQNQIKVQESAQGSLASYRAQIKNLKQAYAELSEEERNGSKGKEMISKMDSLTNSAKAAEWQLQGVPKNLSKTVAAMSQVNFGAGRAAAGIAQMGKAFKALMANPIVLAIGAIVAVIKKLIDSFKKNDQAMTTLQSSLAGLKGILSVVEKAFQAIVNVVSKVIGAVGNFANKVISLIPGMKQYVDAQNDIVVATDNLEDAEREYAKNSAVRQAEISELRNKSTESEKYSYEQRKEFLEQALELERQEADEKRALAEEKLRIAEEEALGEIGYTEMSKEAWDMLSDEQKNTLTELQVAVTNTTTEFNNSVRRMTSQLNSFEKEEKNKRKERAKAAKEAAKERLKNEKEALRSLEDLQIEALTSLQQKEEEQTKASYNRQIEDIKEKLKTEKNLTTKAKEALNQQIVLLESQLQIKLGEISKKYTEDRIENMKTLYQKFYQELAANRPDDIELQVRISEFGYDTQIDALKKRNEEIQKLIKGATDEEKIALENETSLNNSLINLLTKNSERAAELIRYNAKTAKEAVLQANEELQHQIEDNKLLGVYSYNEVEKSKIFEQQAERRLQAAENEHERLKNLSQKDIDVLYNTQEEYQNAVLESENNVVLAQNELADAIRNTNQAILEQQNKTIDSFTAVAESSNQILGAFESIFNAMAEGDEKYAAYAKAMALMQILVSTAISIANAIQGATAAAAATGPGAPIATPVFIAEMIAIVTGAIASAVGVLKKAEKPSKPKFYSGGLIEGTSNKGDNPADDKIEILASKGEYIMPRSAVNTYGLGFMNAIKNGEFSGLSVVGGNQNISFDMEAFKDILVEAVSEVHPTVSVKEINTAQNMVRVKESIAKY